MAKKYRTDGTRMLSQSTDNPKLGAKLLSNGLESLFLDYYLGWDGLKKHRKRENLKLYINPAARTPVERADNNQILELAKKVRQEREQQLKEGTLGYRLASKNTNFIDFLDNYLNTYQKADIRMIALAINRFKKFVAEEQMLIVTPERITHDLMLRFADFLKAHGRGDGPPSIYGRWRKIINYAVRNNILRNNPCEGVSITSDINRISKEILSIEEITLMSQHIYSHTPLTTEVCRAFIFTSYTGIRFCDIVQLKHKHIDRTNLLLQFEQSKTSGRSSSSFVTIPITEAMLRLIGINQPPETPLFKLPSHGYCIDIIRKWAQLNGINKSITWHSGRHSFAVNVLNTGANIKTVSSLLGHASIKHTEKYLHVIDRLKVQAIHSLPFAFDYKQQDDATQQEHTSSDTDKNP